MINGTVVIIIKKWYLKSININKEANAMSEKDLDSSNIDYTEDIKNKGYIVL